MVTEITKMGTIRVAMPPHGLIFGGIEAYHLQEAFGSIPGPPGLQKRPKTDQNVGIYFSRVGVAMYIFFCF